MTMLPILVMFVLAALVCLLLLGLSRFVGPRRPTPVKDAPFECGMEQITTPRRQMSIKFSVVAMLFIIFDIEVAFLYPWAVLFRTLDWAGFVAVLVFLLVLTVGFAYAWRRGALEWS
jgi:NADH-quinone oxidoreductase subunit A